MQRRDVVAGRFVIERALGTGGMGSVYVAMDRVEQRHVAVKVLERASLDAIERFRREARVLSELSHPGIVRYIAHGVTEERQPFLAMELLEGEDLGQRLARSGLSVEDCLMLARRAAEALAFAHGKGVVHRDIKPNNLFLVGGEVDLVKVLDFGIARDSLRTQALTQTGAMLGTVGYMAPEQAMGAPDVDARADVFALGCVLFECLTGRHAFAGGHVVGTLAKVLTEEAPKVSALRSGLGEGIDSLVARMLAKKREDRPDDAAALLRLLDEADAWPPGSVRRLVAPAPASLTRSEQTVVSVILAEPSGDAPTEQTATPGGTSPDTEQARDVAMRLGADLVTLQGGALLFVLAGKGTASDHAAQAASCALEVRRWLPGHRLALATGRAETTGPLPVGAAVDRATTLLRSRTAKTLPSVVVDEVTAGLLGARFEVRDRLLVSDTGDFEAPRVLMGRPTPTVGREKEIALLEATLAQCIDDRVARTVLVTAPPGTGKSRLATEFVGRARRGGRTRVLLARGEAAGGGSLVQQLVRRASRVDQEGPLAAQQARFYSYMQALAPDAEGRLAAEFLGEAIGVPTSDAPSPQLVAARNDPRIMGDRVQQAVSAWLAAECAREPLVLVLEDLHWSDPGSVAHLEMAMGRLAEQPLLVLALARPEARDAFPRLWEDPATQEIKLAPLTRRAAQRLVRAVLGDDAAPATVAGILDRAAGHAFYLEELIRGAAEGREDLPETVMVMTTSRLERLEPEARRVLRAASVFGEAFGRDDVAALLGGDTSVASWLETLVGREVLDRAKESRAAGEPRFRFRHALLRDAAYGMLTEGDRKAGHELAAEWLARRGQAEPLAVAEHFERAGAPARAVSWLAKAVERGIERGELPEQTQRLIDRALSAGASGTERGTLRAFEAILATVRNDAPTMVEAGREAIRLLPVTQPEWFYAASAIAYASYVGLKAGLGAEMMSAVLSLDTTPPPTGQFGSAMMHLEFGAIFFGQAALAMRLLERVDDVASAARRRGEAEDPVLAGYRGIVRYIAETYVHDDVASGLEATAEAEAGFALVGTTFDAPLAAYFRGVALFEAGCTDAAVACLDRALQRNRELGFESLSRQVLMAKGYVLAMAGSDEGRELLVPYAEEADALRRGFAQCALASFLLRAGDADAAELCMPPAREVEALSLPVFHRALLARHALVLLARGAIEEAVGLSERAVAGQESSPMRPIDRSVLLLARAECLQTAGRRAEARDAIRVARNRLHRIANRFDDGATRRDYLANLEPNARTLALATEWLGQE